MKVEYKYLEMLVKGKRLDLYQQSLALADYRRLLNKIEKLEKQIV